MMRVFTSLAVAPMMEPSRAMPEPKMKNLHSLGVSLDFLTAMNQQGGLPSSTEDVGELADHEEEDCTAAEIHQRDPVDVCRWAYLRIDLRKDRCNETVA